MEEDVLQYLSVNLVAAMEDTRISTISFVTSFDCEMDVWFVVDA